MPKTMHMMQNLIPKAIQIDILYSFVIIICSLMIYFATKKLYELSGHKGIKYFRQAFLFFAIVYLFRSSIQVIVSYLGRGGILDISQKTFGVLSLFLFIYASSIAVFYLLYSVMYKKWDSESKIIPAFHIIAVIVAIISTSYKTASIILGLQIILFLFLAITTFISYKDSKKKSKKHSMYIIYFLIFIFFLLNIVDIITPNFLGLQLLIYLASTFLFLLILYKVLRKIGN